LTFGRYLKAKYKTKVSKVPLSIEGFTCPNIDGKVAKGGCTYCKNESFSPNLRGSLDSFRLNDDTVENPLLELQLKSLEDQYKKYVTFLRKTRKVKKFIPYFQSFSNTYAHISTLERLFSKALYLEDSIGISVGTRSDCVDSDKLEMLKGFSKEREVWVEFGVQSVFDKTLELLNRGESVKSIEKAILNSKSRGLNVCAHLIFGLPGEDRGMMLESVKKCIEWGVDSIKFHPLYVVAQTALAVSYKKGEFVPIDEELYIQTLIEAIAMLPKNIIVQRVSAGVDDDSLLSPLWCKDKNILINKIRKGLLLKNLNF